MQKSVKCKLDVTTEQANNLLDTLTVYANVCNEILAIALQMQGSRYDLHKAVYHTIRSKYSLTANYVVRAIARVSISFSRGKESPKQFRSTSLDLDARLFSYNPYDELVSISTINGRRKVRLKLGDWQRQQLQDQKPKSATLNYDGKNFYINMVIEVPEPEPTGDKPLGVDLGINRVIATSEGQIVSGKKINRTRGKYARTKASLQRRGTKGAKRVLKRLSGRQARFMRDVNHRLSKQLVGLALARGFYIVLENLSGIRGRSNEKGKKLRKLVNAWAFFQLQQFIGYKAAAAGVKVLFVDPRYTSQTCSVCGTIGSRRKHKFSCATCGFVADADVNAARNIAASGVACHSAQKTRATL